MSVLHGETVAAGNWPSYDEAMEWAQRVTRNELGWVRFVAPLVSARDLVDELERGMWR